MTIEPKNQLIEIIAQGSDWLVINKPSGLSVHNSPNGQDVISLLSKQLSAQASNKEKRVVVFPVHRLDEGTSGIMLLALTSERARLLAEEFAAKRTHKVYTAVVKGRMLAAEGQWNFAISDKAEGRVQPAGKKPDQVQALSFWKLLEEGPRSSLLEITIATGRQHQIRKHAALAKHPILGDSRYGEKNVNLAVAQHLNFKRLALHSHRLHISIDGQIEKFFVPTPETFFSLVAKENLQSRG